MNNIFFSDIIHIIRETNINTFIEYSDNLFDKLISYENLYNYIISLQSIKKYILYVVHYIRSYIGNKKYNYCLHKNLKCKTILDDININNNFHYVFFLDDHMLCNLLIRLNGASTNYKRKINYYNYILNKNKLNLLISKRKLHYTFVLNNFISNDLIEKICEDYIISNNNIIYKKVINECIFLTKNQYINYYKTFDKPNRVYGKSWNFDNYLCNRKYRPNKYIIYNLQIQPYLFDKHPGNCECDRCRYNIDFPRIRYLYKFYNNPISGQYSNYFNNYVKLLLNIYITRGINYNNIKNKHYKKKKFILGFNRNSSKYNHIILKNNKSKWKQLIKIWNQNL